jgi:hypothetical protein
MSPEEALLIFADCKRAYQLTFGTEAGRTVLADLTKYCRGRETCVATPGKREPIDIYRTFILEGRRDVLLNIQDYLELTPEQLVERYTVQIQQER